MILYKRGLLIASLKRNLAHVRENHSQNLNPSVDRTYERWMTNQDDPRFHDESHLGLFYRYPNDMYKFNSEYNAFLRTINMIPMMVRQPALTMMDLMKQNFAGQLLVYGDHGHGKTHTLAHLVHYNSLQQDRLTIHIRWMKRFTRAPRGHKISTSRPGRIDTPRDAASLLEHIKTQNQRYFDDHKDHLVCSQDYTWSAREKTQAGEPLVALIDHGVNRIIHASDCLAVLIKELMLASNQGKIKLLTIMRNVDHLFHYRAGTIKHPDYKWILIDEMTVARSLKKLIKNKSSLLIASCDDKISRQQNQTPESVLAEDGLSYFEEAKRILVPKFNQTEFENYYNFYLALGWLTRPESQDQRVRDEARFISGLNPGEIHRILKVL